MLHIISSRTWRGAEQQVAYIMNGSFNEINHFLFCPENSALAKAINQNVFTYRKRFGFDISAAIQLKKLCTEQSINIIHLHDSQSINTYYIASLVGLSSPCLIHRHVNFKIRSKWKYRLKGIRKIVCISNEVRQNMLSAVSEEKLIIIHSGIDIKKYSTENKATNNKLRQELKIPSHHKIIGIVTSLEHEKNVAEFIAIASLKINEDPNLHFVIIGDGSLRSILTVQHPQIHFLGFRNDVPILLTEFNVFLFTSLNEGLGIAVLEAMAAKVPVICRNFPASDEYLTDEVSGYLYTTTDEAVNKVNKLLNDSLLQHSFTEKAFETVQDFDVTLMNKKLEELYKSIVH